MADEKPSLVSLVSFFFFYGDPFCRTVLFVASPLRCPGYSSPDIHIGDADGRRIESARRGARDEILERQRRGVIQEGFLRSVLCAALRLRRFFPMCK
jgi:hypothetical protein